METNSTKQYYIDLYRREYINEQNNDITFNLEGPLSQEFWNWFGHESRLFLEDDVQWEGMHLKGIEKHFGGCHHNSFFNSINQNIRLFNGVVIQNENRRNPIRLHSFNVSKNQVIDYTYFFNQDHVSFLTFSFPFKYLGVEIPINFIDEIRRRIEIRQIQDNKAKYGLNYPLASSYFLYTQKDSNWEYQLEQLIQAIKS